MAGPNDPQNGLVPSTQSKPRLPPPISRRRPPPEGDEEATSRLKLGDMAGAAKKPSRPGNASNARTESSANISLLTPTTTNAIEPDRPPKKKRNRGGRNKKNRRRSFNEPPDTVEETADERPSLTHAARASNQASFYRIQSANRSNTSLESEALLDHRDRGPLMSRRQSLQHNLARSGVLSRHGPRPSDASAARANPQKLRHAQPTNQALLSEDEDDIGNSNDRTPLLSASRNRNETSS